MSKEFLDIKVTIDCGFMLKLVRYRIRTYSQIHRTDKYSEHSSVIWPVEPSGWESVYEISHSTFESICIFLDFILHPGFEQGGP